MLSWHTATNKAMAGIELTGIQLLDSKVLVERSPNKDTPRPYIALLVRDVLMAITLYSGKPLFHIVTSGQGGVF